ncbi:FAD-binding protein [Subtercola endophyticus]|uniref:FAD-binding protein n=1 Tax=Subtercola endophyticus TaxID=2895559 RepID=UPI001E36E8CA|nr:FAD-binding protein [Subtercola endophyticus]UFS57992.1 FAD-binding protein [Subtercola endophyticus]
MIEHWGSAPLAPLTTLLVGGTAERMIRVTDSSELVEACLTVWADGEPWFVLGGGSNVVISDEGFDGTVIVLATRGIERLESGPADAPGTVRLRVQAGEPWDSVVAYAVAEGLGGIEALSGIPGSTGAAPVQNIGAYGQELSSVLVGVEFLDYETGEVQWLAARDLGFGYRTSVFKRGKAGVVLSLDLRLRAGARGDGADGAVGAVGAVGVVGAGGAVGEAAGALSGPVEYDQLARALGVELGDSVELAQVRAAVLGLRASKGMVLDPDDPDSVSAGSFFTNPIVSESFARTLPRDAPQWLTAPEEPAAIIPLGGPGGYGLGPPGAHGAGRFGDADDGFGESPVPLVPDVPVAPPEGGYTVKLSAAWLIEQAGIRKGFALPGSAAAISSKHTLAIVNRGGATAEQIAELARFVQWRVQAEFGVNLSPEPVFVGFGAVDGE